MAGAEKIINKIMDDARLQAEDNIKLAKEEAGSIVISARKEAEKVKATIIEKAKANALELKKRKIAVFGLEGRKRLLRARQEVVEEAFSKALVKLEAMPQKEYEEMLAGMITNIAKTGSEEIILSNKDKKRLSNDFIGRINKGLSAKGKDGNIRISDDTGSFSGGFILRADDIEVNNSFDALLRMKHDEIELEVVNILFSKLS